MKFLKGCLNLFLLTIAVIVATVIISVNEYGRKSRIQKVEASVGIEHAEDRLHPVVVTIRNNSEENLISSRWRLAAFEKNRSTQILSSNLYVSDIIIRPGSVRQFRCDVPSAEDDVDAVNQPISDYRWEVVMIDAKFSENHTPVGGDEGVEKIQNSGRPARIRSDAKPDDGESVKPRLLGMKSIRFNIESSGWKKKKGPSFLSKLLDPDSRSEVPVREFEVQLGVTNTSDVRLTIADPLRFDLHDTGRGNVYQLAGMFDGPDGYTDFVLEPSESRMITLVYVVSSQPSSLDGHAWSLRLTERKGDNVHHIITLNRADTN